MAPVARSISLPARSGLVGASDSRSAAGTGRITLDLTAVSPWPAPDPAARVFWMAAPAEYASAFSIVDDAVWGPPVAGTAVPGIPTPDPAESSGAATRTPRRVASTGHGRRFLAAIGAAVVAAAGGLALVIALV